MGIFAALDEKKEELLKSGKKVYNLSVGTPDFEPAPTYRESDGRSKQRSEKLYLSLRDYPELLEAVQRYYKRRFQVAIETDEITSVHGTQEGIGHIGMALLNKGEYCDSSESGISDF